MNEKRRVLIVSHWFPPFHAVASVRMGKLAKYLTDRGWDVRVIAADATAAASLPVEIPRDRVSYAPWTEMDRMAEEALRRWLRLGTSSLADNSPAGSQSASQNAPTPRPPSALRTLAKSLLHEVVKIPDNRAGWIKPAVTAGRALFARWQPDVIFATSPPIPSLIVADRLAQTQKTPWVAEFRDLWTDNPYYEYSAARRIVDRMWERRVMSRATALVTVSPVWQPKLEQKFARRTIVAMNGFDAADFPEPIPATPDASGPLRIVYTGHIYHGHRDPSLLFEALRAMRATPSDVVVEFIGSQVSELTALAEKFGLRNLVKIKDEVSYREALAIQLHADVALHMQWCDPKEEGTIAAKIFDYLGARRPILGLALEDSAAAKIIMSRNAGLVTNDVAKITAQVAKWIAEKKRGGVAPLPAAASAGLEREHQFEKIAALLAAVADRIPLTR